tara:strand:- start:360 stop:599 length:240 start_codon:yes stop_codon:yes gene_type:complete
MFLEAVNARNIKDVMTLIRLSAECGINDDDLLHLQIEAIQKHISDLYDKISEMTQTRVWVWYHSGPTVRDNMIQNMLDN